MSSFTPEKIMIITLNTSNLEKIYICIFENEMCS